KVRCSTPWGHGGVEYTEPVERNGEKATGNGFVSGEWTVAPTRNLLLRGGEEVKVEPRVMDVLAYLAERAGQVVPKDELVERVWDSRHVTDDVLTVTIYALRKALGDDARQPRYIETVSRRGYRWIASVEAPPDSTAIEEGAPLPAEAPLPRRAAWRGVAAAAVVALALVAAGAGWRLSLPSRSRHVPTAESHEEYVKGRYFLDQRSLDGLQQALEHFRRAVALDPQDPAALAGLADTYSGMADFGVASPAEMRPQAVAKSRRARPRRSPPFRSRCRPVRRAR